MILSVSLHEFGALQAFAGSLYRPGRESVAALEVLLRSLEAVAG